MPRDRSLALAALVCTVFGVLGAAFVNMDATWGWDESMHVEYPAARFALMLRDGEFVRLAHAVHDCDRYPFVYPLLQGVVQAVTGLSELVARRTSRLVWALGCFGLFLLVRRVARGLRAGDALCAAEVYAPWIALFFALTSPLALSFSGTLFLEVPFTVASIFALNAWLARDGSRRRELAAGAWLTACFFTKFNYAGLLIAGLGADWVARAILARRVERSVVWLACVPVTALLWWFVLPLPSGLATAAVHREQFVDFLQGNRGEAMRTPGFLRQLHLLCSLVYAPRVLFLIGVGVLASLLHWRNAGVRTLWLVALASCLPVWTHPFHQDRFLIPGAALLWMLAGVGWARLLPRLAPLRTTLLAGLGAACFIAPGVDSWRAFELTVPNLAPEQAEYQRGVLADWRSLAPGRRIYTAGLPRAAADTYLELLEGELARGERIGWIGMSAAFSPGAVHVGLIERGGGSPEVLKRADVERSFIVLGFEDPEWTDAEILAWAQPFHLVLSTEPIDIVGAERRAFLGRYRSVLGQAWSAKTLGTFQVENPPQPSRTVHLFAIRKP